MDATGGKNIQNKCEKFEELFILEDETPLLEHIKGCETCRCEYEKMKKVSGLVKEVSFEYRRKKAKNAQRARVLSMAASFLIVFLAFFALQIQNPDSIVNETIAQIQDGGYTYEQMGLPVDDYGFIMVDYEF